MNGRSVPLMVLLTAVSSGCAWDQRARPVRDDDRLILESMVVRLPRSSGWSVSRRFDAGRRLFTLRHTGADGLEDARIDLVEMDGATPLKPREEERAALATHAATLIGDSAAEVAEVPLAADPRFGPNAVEAGQRATESDAHAGILVKRGMGLPAHLRHRCARPNLPRDLLRAKRPFSRAGPGRAALEGAARGNRASERRPS